MMKLKKETVNILGTEYKIQIKNYEDDPEFKRNNWDGYSDGYSHLLVICDMRTHPAGENETALTCINYEKHTLRHEIVHAFLNESGLKESAGKYRGPWSKNEEMVDWMATQIPKITKLYKELGIL